jgi:hypothetical protein
MAQFRIAVEVRANLIGFGNDPLHMARKARNAGLDGAIWAFGIADHVDGAFVDADALRVGPKVPVQMVRQRKNRFAARVLKLVFARTGTERERKQIAPIWW